MLKIFLLMAKGITWLIFRARMCFLVSRLFGDARGLLEKAIMRAFIREGKRLVARCVMIVECLLLR